jgi:signal transduction histidine kinase/CheY-like chemotaxis protein
MTFPIIVIHEDDSSSSSSLLAPTGTMVVTIQIPPLRVEVPACTNSAGQSERQMKEWIWQQQKESILEHMQIRREPELKEEEEKQQIENTCCTYTATNRERIQKLSDANQRLANANRLLRRASASQLQHFACMSHEIRTPLNCILGLSSLLLDQSQSSIWTAIHTESVHMIASSGDMLLTVVNDVLDYAKLESGNVEIQWQRRNLQETLNSVVYSLETKAARPVQIQTQDYGDHSIQEPSDAAHQRIKVRTLFDARLPEFVTMDSCRLQQILYNLLGNALKFSKPGGVIELAVDIVDNPTTFGSEATSCSSSAYTYVIDESLDLLLHDDHGETVDHEGEHEYIPSTEPENRQRQRLASPEKNGPILRFRVKDYGKGIEQKDFARIFQPFRQASAETEQVYGGTGLGLPVTAKLLHAMSGTISVDSSIQEGWTEFTADLPFYDSAVDLDDLALQEELATTTIYLIDQDNDNAMQLIRTLRLCKIHVEHFQSMTSMEEKICRDGPLDRDRMYVCLVDEALFEKDSYDLLSNLATSVLVTFGSSYFTHQRAAHFRSPNKVLPSVFLRSLKKLVLLSRKSPLVRSPSVSSVDTVPTTELRVLVAEDNIVNQKVLARLLDRIGVKNITIVDNGQKAVSEVLSNDYDLILMDMQMPVMDGLEACQQILNRPDIPRKPKIVFVTANASPSMKNECFEAGAHGFLSKPFNLRDIEKCLNEIEVLCEHSKGFFDVEVPALVY